MFWYIMATAVIIIFNILFIRYAWRTFMKDWEKACHEVCAEALNRKENMDLYVAAAEKSAEATANYVDGVLKAFDRQRG